MGACNCIWPWVYMHSLNQCQCLLHSTAVQLRYRMQISGTSQGCCSSEPDISAGLQSIQEHIRLFISRFTFHSCRVTSFVFDWQYNHQSKLVLFYFDCVNVWKHKHINVIKAKMDARPQPSISLVVISFAFWYNLAGPSCWLSEDKICCVGTWSMLESDAEF